MNDPISSSRLFSKAFVIERSYHRVCVPYCSCYNNTNARREGEKEKYRCGYIYHAIMKRPGPEVCVCDAIKQTTPRSQSIASVGANSLLRLNKKIYIQVEGNGRLRRRKRKKKPISSPGARDRFVSFFFSFFFFFFFLLCRIFFFNDGGYKLYGTFSCSSAC